MIKNNAGIQQFLDAAHEETDKSGKQCDLITFNEFWDEKYGASEKNFDRGAFLNNVGSLQSVNQITYYQELTSYKKGIAPVVFFFKRIIRKINAFLFLPLVAAQNTFNLSVSSFAGHVRNYINREEDTRMVFLKREKELEDKIALQDAQIRDLKKAVNELRETVDTLKGGNVR
ncbi:MAG: hypothetical protein IKN85_03300 [Oscillospiraceae bacterium]|nr:hypothetical protein [Oscillospiraceae bacterium]MBR3534833.1 hypothetical protein [Oscillospiraceae bacterium]MBR6836599.1 hypothetical protein [Oscillospiraceae bacterium]